MARRHRRRRGIMEAGTSARDRELDGHHISCRRAASNPIIAGDITGALKYSSRQADVRQRVRRGLLPARGSARWTKRGSDLCCKRQARHGAGRAARCSGGRYGAISSTSSVRAYSWRLISPKTSRYSNSPTTSAWRRRDHRFFRNYHSMRYVRNKLVFRLRKCRRLPNSQSLTHTRRYSGEAFLRHKPVRSTKNATTPTRPKCSAHVPLQSTQPRKLRLLIDHLNVTTGSPKSPRRLGRLDLMLDDFQMPRQVLQNVAYRDNAEVVRVACRPIAYRRRVAATANRGIGEFLTGATFTAE